ncbi:unnamed protein product, partial [Discosporangium mesarthrocarpum]
MTLPPPPTLGERLVEMDHHSRGGGSASKIFRGLTLKLPGSDMGSAPLEKTGAEAPKAAHSGDLADLHRSPDSGAGIGTKSSPQGTLLPPPSLPPPASMSSYRAPGKSRGGAGEGGDVVVYQLLMQRWEMRPWVAVPRTLVVTKEQIVLMDEDHGNLWRMPGRVSELLRRNTQKKTAKTPEDAPRDPHTIPSVKISTETPSTSCGSPIPTPTLTPMPALQNPCTSSIPCPPGGSEEGTAGPGIAQPAQSTHPPLPGSAPASTVGLIRCMPNRGENRSCGSDEGPAPKGKTGTQVLWQQSFPPSPGDAEGGGGRDSSMSPGENGRVPRLLADVTSQADP